jgi:acyl-CoA synthetase (AMP-forming)/AMP-acid ligase II
LPEAVGVPESCSGLVRVAERQLELAASVLRCGDQSRHPIRLGDLLELGDCDAGGTWISGRESGVDPWIATYKIPRYWKFVDSFPMTVTGKIQKFRMRELAVEELGLELAASIVTA